MGGLGLKKDGGGLLGFSWEFIGVDKSGRMREWFGQGRCVEEFIKFEGIVREYSDWSSCELTQGISSLLGSVVSRLDTTGGIGTFGNPGLISLVFPPRGCGPSDIITVSLDVLKLLFNCSLRCTKILSMIALS
jgi:hypothetical protein